MMIWQSGIKCVQLNGAMNITEKGRAIDTFTNDPGCRIFLMSLKAGGVALNLTVASHVSLINMFFFLVLVFAYFYTAIVQNRIWCAFLLFF